MMDAGLLLVIHDKCELCWGLKSCCGSTQLLQATTEEIKSSRSRRSLVKHTCTVGELTALCVCLCFVCKITPSLHPSLPLSSLFPFPFFPPHLSFFLLFLFPLPLFPPLLLPLLVLFLVPAQGTVTSSPRRAACTRCDVEVETWKMSRWHLPPMLVWLHSGCHGYTAGVMCVAMVTQREPTAGKVIVLWLEISQ